MKKLKVLTFTGGLVVGALLTSGLSVTWAVMAGQGRAKSTSRVVLENERVRVKEAIFAAGDTEGKMHTHEYPHVGVVIDGGTLRFNYPDGKTETMNLPRGGAGYREANVTHQAINTGRDAVRVIEVEIK